MSKIVDETHVDTRGVVTAGTILVWMDTVGGIAARRHAETFCVTASIDAVHFIKPVKLGQIVIISSTVSRSWSTSMEVIVNVEVEDVKTGVVQICCHGFFSFVTQLKTLVPVLEPVSLKQRFRYQQGNLRREKRVERKNRKIVQCLSHNNNALADDQESSQGIQEATALNERKNSLNSSRPRAFMTDSEVADFFVPCSETYNKSTLIIFPNHCNSMEITFGGSILEFMQTSALISANRLTRTDLVIVSFDSVSFLKSTKMGDIITVRSICSAAFKSSIEVFCSVEKVSLDGKNDGWITVCAISSTGQPVKIPKLIPQSRVEKERMEAASARRNERLIQKKEIQTFIDQVKV